jgi:hypothetical protein
MLHCNSEVFVSLQSNIFDHEETASAENIIHLSFPGLSPFCSAPSLVKSSLFVFQLDNSSPEIPRHTPVLVRECEHFHSAIDFSDPHGIHHLSKQASLI